MPLKPPEFYEGREQTYLKHFFLEQYLTKLAYNVLHSWSDFVYVDGFSGPWRSEDEGYEDTSFHIAIQTLRGVRNGFKDRFNKNKQVRCIFVEKNPEAFAELDGFAKTVQDIQIQTIPGEFEKAIPTIVERIGERSFSLIFIDPTGWTGFGLREIKPILQLRGEMLISFMFNDINRFFEDPTHTKAASYTSLYGGPEWFDEYTELRDQDWDREDALLEVYRRRVKRFGSYDYVTTTRIKKPLEERSYFHLVYATRNWKGVQVFRQVEMKAAPLQENVRAGAKVRAKEGDGRQTGLFDDLPIAPGPRTFEQERELSHSRGRNLLLETLRNQRRVEYKYLRADVMQIPLVWESDLKAWLKTMLASGDIEIEGLTGRSTVPKPDSIIVYRG